MPDLDPKRELDDLRDQLQSISFSFKSSMNDIIDTIREVNRAEGRFTDFSLRNIREISFNIDKIYGNINGNIGKAIKGENTRKKIEAERDKIIEIHKKLISDISILEKEINDPKTSRPRSIQLQQAVDLLKDQEESIKGSLALQRHELTQADLFRKKLMPIAGILKGLGKIPIIGDMLNVNRGIEMATEAAQKGKSTFGVFGAGLKGAGNGIIQTFSKFAGIIGIIELVIQAIKFFVGAMFQADKQVTMLAKSFGVVKENASLYRDILIDNKKYVNDILFTTQNQVEATNKLNDIYNTSVIFSRDLLESQIALTKEIGLTDEEASNLNKIFNLNNEEFESGRKSIIQQTLNINKQNSVSLNYKNIIRDVSKLSGEILTNYRMSIPAISDAVAKTEALGINMEQAQKISESLLNFESSISNELEAELLTGKELNLEKARSYALIGNSAKAAEELLKQGMGLNKWENLNVIQKKAYAQAIGLSVEELSNSLIQQENLTKLDSKRKAIIEERVKKLKEEGRTDEANKLMKSITSADEVDKALRSLTIQEKFNAALDKAKEKFTDLVDGGALDKMVNLLTRIVDSMSTAFGIGKDFAKQSESITTSINNNKDIGATAKKASNQIQGALNIGDTPSKLDRFTYEIFGGTTGLKDAEQEIGKNVLARINSGVKISNVQDLAKVYGEEINKNDYLGKHPDRKKTAVNDLERFVGVPIPLEVNTKKDDFIMKGNTITPFRKDDLIMGGTNLMGNSKQTDEMISLLRQIADGLKKGGVILMDGQKVGTAIARGSYNSA